MTACPLCSGRVEGFADGTVLGHVPVSYVRCTRCGSVFLPEPHWLEEAYSHAVSPLDVGLLERCLQLANITHALVGAQGLGGGRFLDFAGGFGTLTRLMRDRGRDFRHHDPLCENVFAQGFEGSPQDRCDLVTAFEVLEHLSDPVQALADVAASTDLLLVTTQVLRVPAPPIRDWDYYAPESGQHVTFYTVQGLRALGRRLGLQVSTAGRLVHLFHRVPLRPATRLLLRDERLAYLAGAATSELGRRRGLTAADRAAVVRMLRATRDEPTRGPDSR